MCAPVVSLWFLSAMRFRLWFFSIEVSRWFDCSLPPYRSTFHNLSTGRMFPWEKSNFPLFLLQVSGASFLLPSSFLFCSGEVVANGGGCETWLRGLDEPVLKAGCWPGKVNNNPRWLALQVGLVSRWRCKGLTAWWWPPVPSTTTIVLTNYHSEYCTTLLYRKSEL